MKGMRQRKIQTKEKLCVRERNKKIACERKK